MVNVNGQADYGTKPEGKHAFEFYREAIQSPHYVAVRRRIFRQLIESMLFEGLIAYQSEGGDTRIDGTGLDGEPIAYLFGSERRYTFGRIRLDQEPVRRRSGIGETEAESIALFLLEVAEGAGAAEEKVLHFIQELEQTLINDTLAQYKRHKDNLNLHAMSDEDWESGMMDGHPYHPSYKSRIGFDITDQLQYGPEFAEAIHPVWVAVHRSRVRVSHSALHPDPGSSNWLREQLGEKELERFMACIREAGANPGDYVMLPVHPWQWRTTLSSVLSADIRSKKILLLGRTDEAYTAQQSIRTLVNRTRPSKHYLKLSLSILNTSTSRILAPHTVENAPVISDWLKRIASRDAYLRDELRLILLGEVAGIAYANSDMLAPLQSKSYGTLSCIWRESLPMHLDKSETAIPYNALCAADPSGQPYIAPWIERFGLEHWLNELLKASVNPIIHLLYAHGIALESHAQNMVLVLREGLPVRVALKDFHDGIRFAREGLANPEDCPNLASTPAEHQRVNRNSFLETNDLEAVRDFVHDAFFFINLGELAIFLQDHFGLEEQVFWSKVRGVIEQYQQRFPEHSERFRQFFLFDPYIGVEQLTARRLFPDTELRMHKVFNPLSRGGELD
ncbi:IucA/IucC family protein [Paenibacillus gorillae]|uniref:IucA/IucC family protein n=1 Tax=Paenibacillus gorillae TaxID=1243662 RepID=UPI0004BA3445|nr:IucA/IucC family protein [Paenibacillus gorillae]